MNNKDLASATRGLQAFFPRIANISSLKSECCCQDNPTVSLPEDEGALKISEHLEKKPAAVSFATRSTSTTSHSSTETAGSQHSVLTWFASLKTEEKHDNDCSNYASKHRQSIARRPTVKPENLLWGSCDFLTLSERSNEEEDF
mmetsp:Transcript_13524/g.20488  ORF Transcript_13524/g.20488 Transcript_13524/m.20488 type:complete len:144 (+) Transcript_13524:100-531(+)